MKKILLVVDVQNDFIDGSLPVPGANSILDTIHNMITSEKFEHVFFTLDTHPANHKSFASNHPGKKVFDTIDLNGIQQTLWPDHCVLGTEGARMHEKMQNAYNWIKEYNENIKIDSGLILKGTNPEVDSYSAVRDNNKKDFTVLLERLKLIEGKYEIYVTGLATDYCVKATVLDLIAFGHKPYIVADATSAVANYSEAMREMLLAGAVCTTSYQI